MPETRAGLVEMSRDECLDILAGAHIGRIAFTHDGDPALLPVTFVLDGEAVVIRVAAESRLARAPAGHRCAFEVDDVEPALEAGCSVVATGTLERVDEEGERSRLGHRLVAWAEGDRPVFLRVRLQELTGRRIALLPAGRRAQRHQP